MVGGTGENREEDIFVNVSLLTDFNISHSLRESVYSHSGGVRKVGEKDIVVT